MASRRVVASIAIVAILAVSGVATYYFFVLPGGPCMTLGGDRLLKSTAPSSTFGALTEYRLPNPGRMSNAIAVAQDGSVWFGEQSVPGVGHLFGNGSLVEYPWPTAAHPSNEECGFETSIWGVALWNGMVWGTNGDQNALVGVNPSSGGTRTINVSGSASFPYTLSVAPDGSLWFTSLSARAGVLGRVAMDYSVSVLPVSGIGKQVPAQIDFVNSSYAYFVALDPASNSGGIYSFNPGEISSSVTSQKLGGSFKLLSPVSVSYGGRLVWTTQHGAASLAALDTGTGSWTIFPTSTVNYASTTLPYFVSVNGGKVWFNEHQGNRIAFIDPVVGTMTEYSESNPRVTIGSAIENDLTIATSPVGAWFTSTTGNYIGFADGQYTPSFSLTLLGSDSAKVQAGGHLNLNFSIKGSWKAALSTAFSDSENYSSVPKAVSMVPSVSSIPSGSGPIQFTVQVSVGAALAPGKYTLDVTITDGLVLRSVFVFLTVS